MTEREVDEDLVRRAQRGEPRAFDLLVLKYQRRLMRLISRYLRDPAEVEDAAQGSVPAQSGHLHGHPLPVQAP